MVESEQHTQGPSNGRAGPGDWHRAARWAAGTRRGRQSRRGDRDSGAAEESGWQLGTGDRGLGGSNGFEAAFPETPHGGRVLDNQCRSANLTC
jgi:hypothetical protein